MPIMTRALIIGRPERKAIADAIDNARVKTLTLAQGEAISAGIPQDKAMLKLDDRPPGWERPPTEQVLIEHGFRCAISFEQQPIGLCRHLSVSIESETPEALPHQQAVAMLCREFGLKIGLNFEGSHVWIEEYEPGKLAVNVVALEPPMH
jgi:hypothetical protein